MDGNIENNAPSTARKEGRMSSCKRATGARLRPRTKASAATKTNPFNICPGIICSFGKMCKDSRGLKIHQAKMSYSLSLHFLPMLSLQTSVCSTLKFYPVFLGS